MDTTPLSTQSVTNPNQANTTQKLSLLDRIFGTGRGSEIKTQKPEKLPKLPTKPFDGTVKFLMTVTLHPPMDRPDLNSIDITKQNILWKDGYRGNWDEYVDKVWNSLQENPDPPTNRKEFEKEMEEVKHRMQNSGPWDAIPGLPGQVLEVEEGPKKIGEYSNWFSDAVVGEHSDEINKDSPYRRGTVTFFIMKEFWKRRSMTDEERKEWQKGIYAPTWSEDYPIEPRIDMKVGSQPMKTQMDVSYDAFVKMIPLIVDTEQGRHTNLDQYVNMLAERFDPRPVADLGLKPAAEIINPLPTVEGGNSSPTPVYRSPVPYRLGQP